MTQSQNAAESFGYSLNWCGGLLIAALLAVAVVPAHAQEPPANGQAEPRQLEPLPAPPFAVDEVSLLQDHIQAAEQEREEARAALAQAQEAASEEGLEQPEQDARNAAVERRQERVQALEARIIELLAFLEQARGGPPLRILAPRREYDRLVTLADRVLRDLIMDPRQEDGQTEGSHARAIRQAEEELARVARAAAEATEFKLQNSRVFQRLSDMDQIEYELRWARQSVRAAREEYRQLAEEVFPAYVRYEERALEGLRAIQTARDVLYPQFRGTAAERIDRGVEFRAPGNLAPLEEEIRKRLSRRRGEGREATSFSIRAHDGRLRAIQIEIDSRADLRTRLSEDVERIRNSFAQSGDEEDESPAAESAPVDAEAYKKLSIQIDKLEAEIKSAREELVRIEERTPGLEEDIAQHEEAERELEQEATALEARIAEIEARFIPAEDASEIQRRRLAIEKERFEPQILLATLNAELDALNERLSGARRATASARRSLDFNKRRTQRFLDRISTIEETELPQVRGEFYEALAVTAGVRALKVVAVFVLAWLLVWLTRIISTPLLERYIRRANGKSDHSADQEQRARTLMTVFMTTVRVVVYITAIMFAIAQFDVDYGPLLVAAGGVSLAVGFGAQTLVKDFFAGFFILLEGQFSIGDVVDVNGKVGTVENLNLRTTVLRSLNGDVHTIPNGSIVLTTNSTKLWSRAVVDVEVAYEENTDDVSGIMEAVAREMREDENWGRKVLEFVIMGVHELGASGVTLRIMLKTRAGEQWAAAREYRRRIKLRFDELGVEIPWPQRVISYKGYADQEAKEIAHAERAKKARILRYVRKSRGEMTEEEIALADVSIEERERARTIAEREAKIAEEKAEESGRKPAVEEEPEPEKPEAEADDATGSKPTPPEDDPKSR